MPYNMILILAPLTIYLNDKNEIVKNPNSKGAAKKTRLSLKGKPVTDPSDKNSSVAGETAAAITSVAANPEPVAASAAGSISGTATVVTADDSTTRDGIASPLPPASIPVTSSLMDMFNDPAADTSSAAPTVQPTEEEREKESQGNGAIKLMDMFNDPSVPEPVRVLSPSTALEVQAKPLPGSQEKPMRNDSVTSVMSTEKPSTTAIAAATTTTAAGKSSARLRSDSLSSVLSIGSKAVEKGCQEEEVVAVAPAMPLLTVVNIKEYVMKELRALHQGDWITQQPTITSDETGESFQAVCVCDKDSIDMVVGRLAHCGVGNICGSINILSLDASMFSKASTDLMKDDLPTSGPNTTGEEPDGEGNDNDGSSSSDEDAAEQRKMFRETASQLRVEQVVEQITVASTMSFDYLSLLLIASVISGVGLAVNSTVSIVASMLVSPIMGPVLALTFGSVINNRKLMKLGLQIELLSLLICVIVGFIIGLVAISWGTENLWPTPEMKSRGLTYGLLVGLAIAVPSGMGVALSVLGNNTSSLVGVAISASLLPPAVNCGMAFAYAAIGFSSDESAVDDDTGDFTERSDYVNLGGISLALTIVNIAAIFVSGSIMFRLKDVTPAKHKIAFWQVEGEELKVYRRHHTAETGINLDNLGDENSMAVLKSVGTNKLLRKELLDLYKQSSLEEDDTALANSKRTIRADRKTPRKENSTASVMDTFNDMENQGAANMKTPAKSPATHRRIHSANKTHKRNTSGAPDDSSSLRYYSPHRTANHYHELPTVSVLELQDTRARMKSFGRSFGP